VADLFSGYQPGLGDPPNFGAAITPNDGADLATSARALWIGGTGAVKITTPGGSTVTLAAVPVGMLWVRAARVWATGTTATNIIALW
jgi:hypothetical protein